MSEQILTRAPGRFASTRASQSVYKGLHQLQAIPGAARAHGAIAGDADA